MQSSRAALLAALALALPPGDAALAVRDGDGWRTWWRAAEAPARWSGPLPAVTDRIAWRTASPGVEWGELQLAGNGEAYRTRVIVARIDPARVTFRLVLPPPSGGFAGRWSIEQAPDDAIVALNAGQFTAGPWGWLVQDGVERQRPGTGPLAPAVVVDRSGTLSLVEPGGIAAARAGAALAFQSYPTLLERDGEVPPALRDPALGVDLAHRDARVAIGELRDGRVLVAITRFDGLGGALDALPFGLTTPEMAAVMGALGARRAVLLDGGISGQMLLREPGRTHAWPGLREVALGLVVLPR